MTAIDVSTPRHVCPKCQQEKPLTIEFWFERASRTKKSWMKHACRNCRNDARRESEKLKAREKRSTNEGRLAINAALRKWKAENPEKRREERRKYAEKQGRQYTPKDQYRQSDVEKAYDKIVEQNAREAFKWWFSKKSDAEVAAWYVSTGKPWNNPRLTAVEKWKTRYTCDAEFHLKEKLRLQEAKFLYRGDIGDKIRAALKRNGETRSLIKIIDYSMSELKSHLEKQFTKKMTWGKFMAGEIHIDHIIPQSNFSLWEPGEAKKCWSLSNLRPMWARENIKKSNKVLTLL